MMKTPNILLITTDQQRYDHIGLQGLKWIRTPNIDMLGSEGVHFSRAYTSSPLCTPARVSLLTGQYPSVHGAYSIGVTLDPFPEVTLPKILKNNGYATALFGKTHYVARNDEERSITGSDDPDPGFFKKFTGPYAGFEYVQVSGGHNISNNPGQHYKVWLEQKGAGDYSKWFPDVNGRHDHNAVGAWDIPGEFHDTEWVTSNVIDWIKGENRKDTSGPWFCCANFQDPHEPFVCPEPWYSSVNSEEIELYEGYREGEFDDKPAFYKETFGSIFASEKHLYKETEVKTNKHSSLKEFDDGHGVPCIYTRRLIDLKKKEAIRATLGMIAFIDDRIGKILKALKETCQEDNTVIIFTSDHGEMMGHHGVWHKGLFAYDDCQRIPLVMWGPSYIKASGTVNALANIVDIPGTILSLAGIEKPQGMQGVDLTPVLKGDAKKVQDHTIVEMQATHKIYQQTYITEKYKLVVYRDLEAGELYDMESDPDQYVNLWSVDEYKELKSSLLHDFVRANMKKEGKVHVRKYFA